MPAPKDPEKYEQWIKNLSESHKGEKNHNFGKPRSEETRKKIAKSNTGKPSWVKGKHLSETHKNNLRASKRGDLNPMKRPEVAAKNGAARRGISPPNKGVPMGEKQRHNLSVNNPMKRPEVRAHNSAAHIGLQAGDKHPMHGKHHSEQSRKNMANGRVGKYCGEENHMWKGGITALQSKIRKSLKYQAWILSVFKRDNFTCQESGIKGGRLNAHHIKPFAQILEENNITSLKQAYACNELWEISNGITLNEKIHKGKHKRKGEIECLNS